MKASDVIKELIIRASGVEASWLELFADAIRAELTDSAQPDTDGGAARDAVPEVGDPSPLGRGGAEKRAIFARLKAWRESHGLGCLRRLEDVANGAVTEDELRAMLTGEPYPITKWRVVDAALSALEEKNVPDSGT